MLKRDTSIFFRLAGYELFVAWQQGNISATVPFAEQDGPGYTLGWGKFRVEVCPRV